MNINLLSDYSINIALIIVYVQLQPNTLKGLLQVSRIGDLY